jgi:hypothetical protein
MRGTGHRLAAHYQSAQTSLGSFNCLRLSLSANYFCFLGFLNYVMVGFQRLGLSCCVVAGLDKVTPSVQR